MLASGEATVPVPERSFSFFFVGSLLFWRGGGGGVLTAIGFASLDFNFLVETERFSIGMVMKPGNSLKEAFGGYVGFMARTVFGASRVYA